MKIDYDKEVLEIIGGFGKWQKSLVALLLLPTAFSGMSVFMYSFIAYVPDHRCRIPQCEETDLNFMTFAIPMGDSCHRYLNHSLATCHSSEFSSSHKIYCDEGWVSDNSIFYSTTCMDFEMVCQGQWKKSFAQSLYMTGTLVGALIIGPLADMLGRRATLVSSCLLLATSGCLCALLPSSSQMYSAFVAMRFLMGMGHAGCYGASFSLAVEYVGPASKRTFCACLIGAAFGLGRYYSSPISFPKS